MANIDVENKILEYNKNCGTKVYDFSKKEFVLGKGKKISMITTTQLRLLLSNAVIVKNKIESENEKALSDKLQAEVKYLLIKHIYQCGREENVKAFDIEFKISDELKQIGNSVEKFNKFYRYLEEIVAYVKYYIG